MLLNRVSRGEIPLCIRSLPSVEPPAAGDVDPGVAPAAAAVDVGVDPGVAPADAAVAVGVGVVTAVAVGVGVVTAVAVGVGVVTAVAVAVGVLPGVGVTATGVFATAVG